MDDRDTSRRTSRRSFVKLGVAGGAAVAGASLLKVAPSVMAVPPAGALEYGSYLIWKDNEPVPPVFRKRNLRTGLDDSPSNIAAGPVVNDAILTFVNPVGGEIWLSDDVDDDSTVITINRDNTSLIAMRKTGSRNSNDPRPHLLKILYAGAVRGGLLRGFHCREITFDGAGNQQQMALEDIAMHVDMSTNGKGLRFLGTSPYQFYQQYINIHNLELALDGSNPIGIEFGNRNSGDGHITFSGHTIMQEESGLLGTPVGIQFDGDCDWGPPIIFDALDINDAGTAGSSPMKPVYIQSHTTTSRGVSQLSIKHFFFEQHKGDNNLFTIEASTAGAKFRASVDELLVSDDSTNQRTVNLIQNNNTQWLSREHALQVGAGRRFGNNLFPAVGGLKIGVANQHTYFRVYLDHVSGLTAFGKIDKPFVNTANQFFCGAGGTSSTPLTATDYVVGPTSVIIAIQASFGPLTIKDPMGNVVKNLATSPTVPLYETVPVGYQVQFGSSGGITVYGI